MQIQSNCMRYSITLRKFAKRALITFGAVQKVICYSLEFINKSKKKYLLNDYLKFLCESLLTLNYY
jgi:hypothetical protein